MTSKQAYSAAVVIAIALLLCLILAREFRAYQHPIPGRDPRGRARSHDQAAPDSASKISGTPSATPVSSATNAAESPTPAAGETAENASDDNEMADGVWTDEALEKLIEIEGSVRAAYQKCDRDGRESLIDYLMAEEKLRANLPDLLLSEADTDLRAFMLLRVEPEGYFASEEEEAGAGAGEKSGANEGKIEADASSSDEEEEKVLDEELRALLDEKPSTAMGTEEWKARLELALLLGEDYAARWVRDALEQNPDNAEIRSLASLMLLNLAAAQEEFGPSEAREAQEYLCGNFEQIANPQERIRAYQALLFSPDREAALVSLRARLGAEPDARARRALERVVAMLENPPEGGAQLIGVATPQPAGT